MSDLDQIAEAVARRLIERGESVAVAESAAGGRISAALLGVAGASAYYKGGAVLYTGTAWAMSGPLQPGWVAKSGTPPAPVTSPTPVHPGPGGFTDPLVGVMTRDAAGNTSISFRDSVDTALTILIRPPGSTESMPVVTVARGTRQLCATPANATTDAPMAMTCRRATSSRQPGGTC